MAEVTQITRSPKQAGGARQGTNIAALMAPLDAGASVSANAVALRTLISSVRDDFGEDSKQLDAALAAFASDAGATLFGGAEEEVFEETFQTASGQLGAGSRRATEITSVSSDGTDLTVETTAVTPPVAPSDADTFRINLATGEWAVDAGSEPGGTGAGVIIDGKRHDWTSLFNKLVDEPHKIVAPSGFTARPEDWGVLDAFREYAEDNDKLGCIATPSGADRTDAETKAVLSALGSSRWFAVASDGYTGDHTSAVAAERARRSPGATAKQQEAPGGITYTESVSSSDYGTEESPTSGTWHELGVNAIFRDEVGVYRYSNDRAMTALGDFYRFWSTQRSEDEIADRTNARITRARRASGLAFPFTAGGLASVRGIIEGVMADMAAQRIVNAAFTKVVMPELDDISDQDRLNRVVPDIEITFRLQGQMHLLKVNLAVNV